MSNARSARGFTAIGNRYELNVRGGIDRLSVSVRRQYDFLSAVFSIKIHGNPLNFYGLVTNDLVCLIRSGNRGL
jgi:hypothetical protein